ncbi:MAG: Mut7-C RNAse domain-containing protein [Actinomycetota bacterium]
MSEDVRFIADVMLGKLATWMRLLGCDVEYFPKISDEDLAERAFRTGRVILTRDAELIRRRHARDNHFFVRGDGYRDQLRQVATRFSIEPLGRILTRCLRCNEPLSGIDKSAVRERVPPYVYETQHDFKTCDRCGRIYWRGTHRDEAVKQVMAIFGVHE